MLLDQIVDIITMKQRSLDLLLSFASVELLFRDLMDSPDTADLSDTPDFAESAASSDSNCKMTCTLLQPNEMSKCFWSGQVNAKTEMEHAQLSFTKLVKFGPIYPYVPHPPPTRRQRVSPTGTKQVLSALLSPNKTIFFLTASGILLLRELTSFLAGVLGVFRLDM